MMGIRLSQGLLLKIFLILATKTIVSCAWYRYYKKMTIQKEVFDSIKDSASGNEIPIYRYTLSSSKGVIVKLISLGATINSVQVPDKNSKVDYVTLGFDSAENYIKFNYLGTTIGRCGNRIKNGKFHLNGADHQLTINNNGNHLHGGKPGWDKAVWESFVSGDKVTFTHRSPDGDQGYPGEVMAQVSYSLDEDGSLKVDYQAMSSKATPINMTNHSFFNLAGHASGQKGLFEHDFEVLADGYLPVSSDLIPTGVIESVTGTAFDLRQRKPIRESLAKTNNGFDHCFCFPSKKRGDLDLVAVIDHPPSGRKLEVFTTELGLQVYTGNFMPREEGKMVGRGGISYMYQGAFCCEPQNFPDSINQANFPNAVLLPGDIYKHSLVYKFTTN